MQVKVWIVHVKIQLLLQQLKEQPKMASKKPEIDKLMAENMKIRPMKMDLGRLSYFSGFIMGKTPLKVEYLVLKI